MVASPIIGADLMKTLGRIYLQHNMRESLGRQSFEAQDRPAPQIICSEALV
jgi:hypothetical protein